MRNIAGAFGAHACDCYSFFQSEATFHVCCSVGLAHYLKACYLDGNVPPIAATLTQQFHGSTVRPWKLFPVRRLEGAECSVPLVIPSIVDGLLTAGYRCCRRVSA